MSKVRQVSENKDSTVRQYFPSERLLVSDGKSNWQDREQGGFKTGWACLTTGVAVSSGQARD